MLSDIVTWTYFKNFIGDKKNRQCISNPQTRLHCLDDFTRETMSTVNFTLALVLVAIALGRDPVSAEELQKQVCTQNNINNVHGWVYKLLRCKCHKNVTVWFWNHTLAVIFVIPPEYGCTCFVTVNSRNGQLAACEPHLNWVTIWCGPCYLLNFNNKNVFKTFWKTFTYLKYIILYLYFKNFHWQLNINKYRIFLTRLLSKTCFRSGETYYILLIPNIL